MKKIIMFLFAFGIITVVGQKTIHAEDTTQCVSYYVSLIATTDTSVILGYKVENFREIADNYMIIATDGFSRDINIKSNQGTITIPCIKSNNNVFFITLLSILKQDMKEKDIHPTIYTSHVAFQLNNRLTIRQIPLLQAQQILEKCEEVEIVKN